MQTSINPASGTLQRFLVYRAKWSDSYLCVCAARDRRHALKIARRMFRLDRTAFAIPEKDDSGWRW